MPTEKPLPCPFCGAAAVVEDRGVYCPRVTCPATIVAVEIRNQNEAIRRWNTRAGSTR